MKYERCQNCYKPCDECPNLVGPFAGSAEFICAPVAIDHCEVIETRHYVDYATQLPIIEYEHKDGYCRVEIDMEKLLVSYSSLSGVALAFIL